MRGILYFFVSTQLLLLVGCSCIDSKIVDSTNDGQIRRLVSEQISDVQDWNAKVRNVASLIDRSAAHGPRSWSYFSVIPADESSGEIHLPLTDGRCVTYGIGALMAPRVGGSPPTIGQLVLTLDGNGEVHIAREQLPDVRYSDPYREARHECFESRVPDDAPRTFARATLALPGHTDRDIPAVYRRVTINHIDPDATGVKRVAIVAHGLPGPVQFEWTSVGPYASDLAGGYIGRDAIEFVPERQVDYWIDVILPEHDGVRLEVLLTDVGGDA